MCLKKKLGIFYIYLITDYKIVCGKNIDLETF